MSKDNIHRLPPPDLDSVTFSHTRPATALSAHWFLSVIPILAREEGKFHATIGLMPREANVSALSGMPIVVERDGQRFEGMTDAHGEVRLRGLAFGDYSLQATSLDSAAALAAEELSAAIAEPGEEDLAASGWQSFAERLQETLRKFFSTAALAEEFHDEPAYALTRLAVHASGDESTRLIFNDEVFFGGEPGSLMIWEEEGGLRISAMGPKKLIGRAFKITIAEDEPMLVFRPYEDQALGKVIISWNRGKMSPETVSKLTVSIQPS